MILDLQENIYNKIEKTEYPSAGEAGWRIVGFGDWTDMFLEVQQHKNIVERPA